MAIADLVKSTLGPKGMDKILQSVGRGHGVTVTNDGATILRSIYVDNPAAKVLVDISRVQDEEVGDGTTSVVVLAGELLREAEKLVREFLVCFPPFSTSSGGRPFFCFVWAVFFFFFFAFFFCPSSLACCPLSAAAFFLSNSSILLSFLGSQKERKKKQKEKQNPTENSLSLLFLPSKKTKNV